MKFWLSYAICAASLIAADLAVVKSETPPSKLDVSQGWYRLPGLAKKAPIGKPSSGLTLYTWVLMNSGEYALVTARYGADGRYQGHTVELPPPHPPR